MKSSLIAITIHQNKSIKHMSSIDGRYNVYTINGKKIIIDFAHNEASFEQMYKSVKSSDGKIFSVFGSVGGRSQARRKALARVSEKYADLSIITADNPAFENVNDICSEIYSEFKDKSKACIIADREDAIKFAILSASRGDFVLLLGKGHEEFQLVGDKRVFFSERELLLNLGFEKII